MTGTSNTGYGRGPGGPVVALAALLATLTACGGASVGAPAAGEVAVAVAPSSARLAPGGRAAFAAAVTGTLSTAVTWTVQEGSAGGTVTSGGAYTAPAGAGVYHVVATSQADPARSGSAAVTVTAAPAPVIASFAAAPSSIAAGGTATLSWSVSGATSLSIDQGIGAVTGSSRPVSPAATTTYVLTATNAAGSSAASATVTVTAAGGYVNPSPISGDVVVSLDSSTGTTPVSPYVFGSLGADQSFASLTPLHRNGGNRMTGYNWENGYSNAGSDWGPYHNDTLMAGNGTPGATYRDTIGGTFGRSGRWKNGVLLTLPTIGYAAGTWTGNSTLRSSPDVLTVTPPLVGTGTAADRWRLSLPGRPGDATHAQATATPALGDDTVYQDDFLLWLKTNWPGHDAGSAEPIFIALDNEPDLWASTHPEIRGRSPAQHVQTGYDELAGNNATYAKLVKDLLGPGALVFGPVLSGWMGFYDLGNVDAGGTAVAPPSGYSWYLEYYLKKMSDASAAEGRRLLDVVDVHWYPEASGTGGRIVFNDGAAQDASMVTARVQAPRSLWDPSYLEDSWITNWDVGIPGCTWGGDPRRCSLKLIPTLKQMIAARFPGTRIAITEWSYGREMDVSNAVASADVLGILAREGVFAANTWPMSSTDGCLAAAMKAFLDYDGARGRFGDTYIPGTVADPNRPADSFLSGKTRGDGTTIPAQTLERVTAYASYDAGTPGRVVVVAINKDLSAALSVGFRIKHDAQFGRAEVYRITGTNGGAGGCTGPTRQADVSIAAVNAFAASLPPLSVTVLVLRP